MRKLSVGVVGILVLLSTGAGPAGAITFDLKFQSSGGSCTAGAATCSAEAGATVLIDVVFTINVNRLFTSSSVGLDLSAMGLAPAAVTATAFAPPFPVAAVFPLNGIFDPVGDSVPAEPVVNENQASTCVAKLAGCDHRFKTFGFLAQTSAGSGTTYTAGTLTLDLTGANLGAFTIVTYHFQGIDGPPDNGIHPHNVALLTIVPEPATAALLGVGLLGLVAASRRGRARTERQPGA